ncbi:hypothetical protein [Burkholderia gladioli]|uniref:hypothetical protein n=1 Tax=Burkholderia gladioli TaxID=28095 RepID=UPI001641F6F9|nr:hypothetical protein [Burkholderia gladioli]
MSTSTDGTAAASAQDENILMAPPGEVDTACHNLSSKGVNCVFPGEQSSPEDASNGGLPLQFADLPWVDASRAPRVGGLLFLSEKRSPAGNTFYSAKARIYKFDLSGNRSEATSTSPYYDKLWAVVGASVSYAPDHSETANSFVERLDRQIASEKEAESKKVAVIAAEKKKRDADEAYLASPEYKRKQAAARVTNCRKQISMARAALAHDERVAQISGYENKLLRESAAQTIVNCQDTIAHGGYSQNDESGRADNANMPAVVHYRLDGIE